MNDELPDYRIMNLLSYLITGSALHESTVGNCWIEKEAIVFIDMALSMGKVDGLDIFVLFGL